MADTLVLIAVIILVAAVILGTFTKSTWRNVGITWSLLAIGAVLYGIALTL